MTAPKTESPSVTTLVNYIELWIPEKDRLKLKSSVAIDSDSVRHIEPRNSSVALKEGIAGSAWSQESPVILQGPSSIIEQVASESGLPIQGLIAIPVYREFDLVSVLVFGLSSGHGGFEIWTRDDRDELSISGSYYAGLEAFEFISQYVRFPKGAGLPGNSWKSARPLMIDGPGKDPEFIRSFDRDAAHLEQCIGIPISREYGFPASILLMLSDVSTPLARSIDIWHCNSEPEQATLQCTSTHSGISADSEPWVREVCNSVAAAQGAVLLTSGNTPLPDGIRCGVVMPFFANDHIEDLLVMLF